MGEWHRWDCPDCGEVIVHECGVENLEKATRPPPPYLEWEFDGVRSV